MIKISQPSCTCWISMTTVVLALLSGLYFPIVITLKPALPYLLFSSLLLMMIDLDVKNGFKVFKDMRLVLIFVTANFMSAPLLASIWAGILFSNANPYYAVGFILNVVMPCSSVAAIWTGYAKGRVSSAISIIPLNIVLTVFMAPIMMSLLTGVFVQVQIHPLFYYMLMIVAGPLIVGQIIRKQIQERIGLSEFTKKISPVFQKLSVCGILLIIFIIISSQAQFIITNLKWMLLIVLGVATLQPLLAVITLFFSKSAAADFGDSIALIYNATAKNYLISMSIALIVFENTPAVLPAVIALIIQRPLMLGLFKSSDKIMLILKES